MKLPIAPHTDEPNKKLILFAYTCVTLTAIGVLSVVATGVGCGLIYNIAGARNDKILQDNYSTQSFLDFLFHNACGTFFQLALLGFMAFGRKNYSSSMQTLINDVNLRRDSDGTLSLPMQRLLMSQEKTDQKKDIAIFCIAATFLQASGHFVFSISFLSNRNKALYGVAGFLCGTGALSLLVSCGLMLRKSAHEIAHYNMRSVIRGMDREMRRTLLYFLKAFIRDLEETSRELPIIASTQPNEPLERTEQRIEFSPLSSPSSPGVIRPQSQTEQPLPLPPSSSTQSFSTQ